MKALGFLLLIGFAVLANRAWAAKAAPKPSAWPDHYSVNAWGGAAIPLSPRGPDSFTVSYARAPSGGGGLFAHWGSWGLGVEGTSATLAHQNLDHTSVNLVAGAVVMEWNFQFEEGREEGPLFQWGAGFGQGRLDSVYPGGHSWSAPATKLGTGYRIALGDHVRMDLLASTWALLAADKWDPVAIGDLGLQVGLWW